MSETGMIEAAGLVITIIIFLISLYLNAKDNAQQQIINSQQKQITDMVERHAIDITELTRLHTEDVKKLGELELTLAKKHFEKGEILGMFDKFKEYLDEKFKELRTSVDAIDNRRHGG